jgi:hypothetical protein
LGIIHFFSLSVSIYFDIDKESNDIPDEERALHLVLLGIVWKESLMTAKTNLTWQINLISSLR